MTNPVLNTLNLTLPVGSVASSVTCITLGIGQGEYSLDPNPVLLLNTQNEAIEIFANINTQQFTTENTDITISLNELITTFPNLKKVIVEIGWYVNNLNCSITSVMPGVINTTTTTTPYEWSVMGLDRSQAYLISQINGLPAYRGTPADQSILNLLLFLTSLQLDIGICMTLLSDVQTTNLLLNPYSNNGAGIGQPSYTKTDLITVNPAKGFTNTVYGTSSATGQIQSFFGSGEPPVSVIFSANGQLNVALTSTPTFNYSTFVLYYATLLSTFRNTFKGISLTDFIIGKSLSGLTSVIDNVGNFAAVSALSDIATTCGALFGSEVAISYAADWDEWQGTGIESPIGFTAPNTRIFNMDALWVNPAISYIAINANFPTTDWRNVGNNFDGLFFDSPSSQPYIVNGLLGNQFFDFFYANETAQINQIRTPIVGPTSETTWIYQLKNFDTWLNSNHFNFNGTSFSENPTVWQPQNKPIVFYNVLCPSVNIGTNQPDADLHTVSSDFALPIFSNGAQDLTIQSNFYPIFSTYVNNISANLSNWGAGYWDDRPFPWYPKLNTQWIDTTDYNLNASLNNKTANIDPTATYTQFVNYNKLLTEQMANNPFWVTLVDAFDLQWNTLFNNAVNQLANIRNVNVIEDELKAANVRQFGFVIPDFGLEYFQYDNLMRYLGTFYLTRGNSNQFVNFVSFFSQIDFTYIPLFANGLNFNTLTSQPGTLVTQSASGTWIPTPYYDVSFDPGAFPNVNEDLYRQIFIQAAPIYLVLRNFQGETTIAAVPQFLSATMIDMALEVAPAIPVIDPPGLSLLSITTFGSYQNGIPFSVSGTTLGPADSVQISVYTTNNVGLILSNRLTPLTTASLAATGHNWTTFVSASGTNSQIFAVVTDTTQTTKNKTITLNEIAISSPIILSTGPEILDRNGNTLLSRSGSPLLFAT
jgi:hypothetical protein